MARTPHTSPHTRAVLAALLAAYPGRTYGYDLSRATSLKSGTLYPILQRLHGVSLALGWKGRLPLAVGVATLVYLPTEWLAQALTHQGSDLTAGEALFRMVILAVLAVNAAGVGGGLRRFLRPS